ncbi:hypothetical protein TVAG_299420 [Trichomonas vaginalis G3]|uniref:Uncharacterized protein n=1 Tax=Trichomonas vaginalis (strain ATCC PRA-98 / G3) TaxID=412133 RepID=A2EVR9_TRIV3|nr:dynein heavy chain binding [Trichomonas vaginalis G3]EAY03279.1 hypothetical protein TVAG_299420 [Trichomonas vaginalis G3]KAI5535566.1 dynein heavy chain binding [Trichomonas vaginalis G3]|eukprot:XP_001315502.1 hypothetical protein [Trichomonas vaginalis G3]
MTEEEAPAPPLTIEEEVKLLTVQNTRNLFQLLITRPQKELNKKRNFVDRDSHLGTEGLVEYRSFKDPNYDLVRATLDCAIQSSEQTTEVSSQTPWCRKVNSSAQTIPVTFLPELRQSIQEQEDFLQFAHKIAERVSPVLESNVSSDVFQDQLANLKACDDSLVKSFSVSQLKEFLSLKDARFSSPVTCIDVMPGSKETVGISFASSTSFDQYMKRSANAPVEHIFIWNFQAILHPQYVLESPSVVLCFKFCPHNPNIVVGGCENGQVLLWDISDEKTKISADLRTSYSTEDSFSTFYHPKYASTFFGPNLTPSKSHTQPVYDLKFLPKTQKFTRIGEVVQCENTTQFATISVDGHLIIWDIDIDESTCAPNTHALLPGASLTNEWLPTFNMNLFKSAKENIYYPGTIFGLLTDNNGAFTGDCRFVTEYGDACAFNWINGPDKTVIGRQNPYISSSQQLMYHTAVGFVENPFVHGLFVGCDRCQVVLADLTNEVTELFRSAARHHPATCVAFSPTRPSVFVVGKENGDIEVWSILDKSHECLFSQSVASSRVSSLAFGTAKTGVQLLCIGCGDGTLMIFQVPSFMSNPAPNEEEQLRTFVEQQNKFVAQTRERFNARGGGNKKTEQVKAEGQAEGEEEKAPEEEDDGEKVDVELVQFEKEYAKIIKEFEEFEKKQDDE